MTSISENEIADIALCHLLSVGYEYNLGTFISADGTHREWKYTDVVFVARVRDSIDQYEHIRVNKTPSSPILSELDANEGDTNRILEFI